MTRGKPLAKLGMKLTDVDRYGVELHNPEITFRLGAAMCREQTI